jgi:hypothetical protein
MGLFPPWAINCNDRASSPDGGFVLSCRLARCSREDETPLHGDDPAATAIQV